MKRPIRFNSEQQVHQQVVDYLKLRYSWALFRTDFAAGLKLPAAVAIRHAKLQSGKSWPDLFIAEPSHVLSGEYRGLFIELKAPDVVLYKKDGTLRANEHIEAQAAVLEQLRSRGFKAEFAVGYDQARELIDEYLTGGKPTFF